MVSPGAAARSGDRSQRSGLSSIRALAAAASVGVAVGSLGCGPASPAETPIVEARWDSMGAERRLAHMRSAVTPRMKAVFMSFDRHRYPRFDCKTCHGADGPERAWRMPNPDLLLEPTPWNTGVADPRDAPSSFDAFMASDVAPAMARLLGREVFGCFGCHAPDT